MGRLVCEGEEGVGGGGAGEAMMGVVSVSVSVVLVSSASSSQEPVGAPLLFLGFGVVRFLEEEDEAEDCWAIWS